MNSDPYKVLVLMDFSNPSVNAANYAFEWSALIKAEVILLHSYRLISNTLLDSKNYSPKEIKRQIEVKSQSKFQNLKNRINFDLPYKWSFKMELGFVESCTILVTQEESIDMIVLGVGPFQKFGELDAIKKIIRSVNIPVFITNEYFDQVESGEEHSEHIVTHQSSAILKGQNLSDEICKPNHPILLIHPSKYDPKPLIRLLEPKAIKDL